ncbi:MAG TPA: ester cyclase [Gemmatimonadales bacterium]|nr:ester cyclase [Gemmatimonadales bacterium]
MSRNEGATIAEDQQSASQRRLAIVLEHMHYENAHDFDRCIAAFGHPRYEIVPTGEVHDGRDGVNGLLDQNRVAFADFHFEPHRTAPADDVVLVEGTFTGTHTGTWRGLPATGRTVCLRMALVFEFEGDALVCERVYFDLGTALRQLGVARDPLSLAGQLATIVNHPITIARALLRGLFQRQGRGNG